MTSPHPTPGARRGGVRERIVSARLLDLQEHWRCATQTGDRPTYEAGIWNVSIAYKGCHFTALKNCGAWAGSWSFSFSLIAPMVDRPEHRFDARVIASRHEVQRIGEGLILRELELRRPPGARGKKGGAHA